MVQIAISVERKRMKYAGKAVFALSVALASPVLAASAAPAAQATAGDAAHVKAVQDLLGAMQVEKVLRGVAARSRYASEAQRQAVFAKLQATPPAEVYRRMAAPLASAISTDTALEMTRFYQTPYGKQVIHDKYNSSTQLLMPGMKAAVPPGEAKERKRAAYVNASKALADAQPAIEREAFKLLQMINRERS
jgi:hypothetical protein